MTKIKHFFKVVAFYFKYAYYVSITMSERSNYLKAKEKGYDCISSHDDSRILYGSARKFYFDVNKPPTRHYITYQKHKQYHYPKS